MELRNQIVLVILIPILLILLIAMFQVSYFGFVSIPSFQDSLRDYQIARHLNGIKIEINTIEQEVTIQYQAYLNQVTGFAHFLKHYSLGPLSGQTTWEDTTFTISPDNALNRSSDQAYHIDWQHRKYTKLEQIKAKNATLYNLMMQITKGFSLGRIILDNNGSVKDYLNIPQGNRYSRLAGINYRYFEVVCSDSLRMRYPQYKTESTVNTSSFQTDQCDKERFQFNVLQEGDVEMVVSESINSECQLYVSVNNDYLLQLSEMLNENKIRSKEQVLFAFAREHRIITNDHQQNLNLSQALMRMQKESVDAMPFLDEQIRQLDGSITNFSWAYSLEDNLHVILKGVCLRSKKEFSLQSNGDQPPILLVSNENLQDDSEWVFVIAHVFDELSLLEQLSADTEISNLNKLKIIVFVLIVALSIMVFAFAWYITTKFGANFDQPILMLTDFMNSMDIQNLNEQENHLDYEEYFICYEIQALFKTIDIFITTIRYSNQKYSNSSTSDSVALMELSRAKHFFKTKIHNMPAVGICANNIAIIHMKNDRVFEAVSEIEEAIYIAQQELQEIKEVKKWCNKMIQSHSEPNFYLNFKHKLLGLANKFRQIEFGWIHKLKKNNYETIKRSSKSLSRSQLVQLVSKNYIENQNLKSPQLQGQSQFYNLQNQNLLSQPINSPQSLIRKNKKSETLVSNLVEVDSPLKKYKTEHDQKNQYHDNFVNSQRINLKESILPENKNSSENQNNQNQPYLSSELDLIEEKLKELEKKKQLANVKLQNRQFQLASFMFHISIKYTSVFIPETLLQLQKFEKLIKNQTNDTYSKFVRNINLQIKKALCYIQVGDISNFLIELNKSEELYKMVTKEGLDQLVEEMNYNFVDIFKNVPLEVLFAKIQQLKVIYELLQGNFQNSGYILISMIEKGEYYDPEIRDFCLIILEQTFKRFDIPTTPIQQYKQQISQCVYEVIMMIDYSNLMTIDQIMLSHSLCVEVFKILQPYDQVGLYGFNDLLHEGFPLQPKGNYDKLLQKQLSTLITAKGGDSNLYKALKYVSKYLFSQSILIPQTQEVSSSNSFDDSCDSDIAYLRKAFKIDNSEEVQQEIKNKSYEQRNKYKFICLFTESNNKIIDSSLVQEFPNLQEQGILQQIMLEKNVDLLVFNIANQNANMLDLKELSRITPKSMFLNAKTSLETVFGQWRQYENQKKIYLEFF